MASDIDQVTITYEEDGIEVVKELDKEVLTKGAWATIIFKYQDWNNAKQEYSPVKYSIRRYRKFGDNYSQQSKFNISSDKQAQQLIDVLSKWMKED